MRLQDSELADVPTFLYGGVNGAIGLIASLPRELFEMLAQLQDGLRKARCVGTETVGHCSVIAAAFHVYYVSVTACL
jgi:hypothetical protein